LGRHGLTELATLFLFASLLARVGFQPRRLTMFYPKTVLFVAALAGGFVLSAGAGVHAEHAPVAGPLPVPPASTMWTDPPEAVRTAAAALRAACADWQQERPLPANPSPAEAVHPRPSEVTVCEVARDPDEARTMQVTSYVVLAVAGVGLAGATFVTVMSLLRMLVLGISRVAAASWEAWPSSKRNL